MREIKDFLQELRFFDGLDIDKIEYVAGCGQNMHFRTGEYIGKEGEPADYLYIIKKGKVAVQMNHPVKGELTIRTLQEDDIGGFSWIIPPYTMQFDLKVLEPTSVIALGGNCLRKKCEEDHELGYFMMKQSATVMNRRLMNTRIQLLDVYSSRV
jgi:CRP/FNR family cyclic AMP-dependent transcriptional regulator